MVYQIILSSNSSSEQNLIQSLGDLNLDSMKFILYSEQCDFCMRMQKHSSLSGTLCSFTDLTSALENHQQWKQFWH